jgi:Holliday junction resolvase RusA-like endonuclease
MTFELRFTVHGDPTPKGRPRFSMAKGFVQTYTTDKTRIYETYVWMVAKVAMGSRKALEGPLRVSIEQVYTVPASYSKKRSEACLRGLEKHTKRPDVDNVVKSIIDGMGKEQLVFLNDSQIIDLHSTKEYGTVAKVNVILTEI